MGEFLAWYLKAQNNNILYFNRNVLDIDQPGKDKIEKIKRGHKICTWPLHCQPNQEWFFKEDKTIESGVTPFVMDIDLSVKEGAPLIVWTKNGKPNQLFNIIQVETD